MVEGNEDEESYASEFVDSMLNDDDNDSGTRIEPVSHKKIPKNVNDDDNNDKDMKDEKKDDDRKKDDAKDKDNDDHTDHSLVRTQETGSKETRKEKMQTPIPTPNRSLRKNLSSDKTLSQELTKTVSPSNATTSKAKSKARKHLKTTFVTKEYFQGQIQRILDQINNLPPKLTVVKTNEMIKEEVSRLVNLAVQRDREIALTNVPELISQEFATNAPGIIAEVFQKHMQNTTLNLYPTTTISSTATTSTADIQHQLYLTMKLNIQD
ncbi:hypothetical protein Tco_0720198 [Tanacetum coccineum]